jgi:RNA binding exosome subunit
MDTPFHYVVLSTFCYATEIFERVLQALHVVVVADPDADILIEKNMVTGHFGDQLIILTARLDTAPVIRDFCSRTFPLVARDKFVRRIDDNCFFYLRFSKEAAYEGGLELTDTGNIITARGKIKAYPACWQNAIGTLQEAVAFYRNG